LLQFTIQQVVCTIATLQQTTSFSVDSDSILFFYQWATGKNIATDQIKNRSAILLYSHIAIFG